MEGSRALGSAASRCIGLYGNIPTMGVYSGLNLALGSQQTSLGLIVANGHAIKKLSTRISKLQTPQPFFRFRRLTVSLSFNFSSATFTFQFYWHPTVVSLYPHSLFNPPLLYPAIPCWGLHHGDPSTFQLFILTPTEF